MRPFSPACRALALEHLPLWPPSHRFRGEPSYETLELTFWACAVEAFAGDAPSTVLVGRQQIELPVSADFWHAFRDELGLHDPDVWGGCARLLRAPGAPRPLPTPLAAVLPPPTLGLVLLATHLADRSGPAPFAWADLTNAAVRHPLAREIGPFDEQEVGWAVVEHAGIGLRRDPMLSNAEHAFARPLKARLGPPPEPAGDDWLLRGLKQGTPEPAAPRPEDEILDELRRLRTENDRLRGHGLADALGEVLGPLLEERSDPEQALARPDPALLRRVGDAVRGLLLRSPLTFIGTPGDEIAIQLPASDYRLDPAARPGGRADRFRVTRRGLRLNGEVIVPAWVVPLEPARAR